MLHRSLGRRAVVWAGLLLAAGLADLGPARAAPPLDVVATIAQIGEAAQRIGGERVKVRPLMGEGVDPHTYRQTRSDVVALARADLVLHNGLHLEAQLEELLADLAGQKPVVAVAESLPVDARLASTQYPGRFDPHIWMDTGLWSEVVEAVGAALAEADPEGAPLFAANAETYRAEIARVGDYARTVLATVPEPSRVVLSSHDAFGYFGRAFGWEVIGIQGLSTESEAGLGQIEALVELIVERELPAVFVESSVSERNVRALIEGAAARGHKVRIGGQLFSDAMGAPGSYTGTYVGMIDSNVTTIARALGGNAPAGGLNGRLAAGS
jgi:manganese/zinc/iron transport system substrate-binding protein